MLQPGFSVAYDGLEVAGKAINGSIAKALPLAEDSTPPSNATRFSKAMLLDQSKPGEFSSYLASPLSPVRPLLFQVSAGIVSGAKSLGVGSDGPEQCKLASPYSQLLSISSLGYAFVLLDACLEQCSGLGFISVHAEPPFVLVLQFLGLCFRCRRGAKYFT